MSLIVYSLNFVPGEYPTSSCHISFDSAEKVTRTTCARETTNGETPLQIHINYTHQHEALVVVNFYSYSYSVSSSAYKVPSCVPLRAEQQTRGRSYTMHTCIYMYVHM